MTSARSSWGFLPFVSGAGIFLLLGKDVSGKFDHAALAPLASMGFVITVGLLLYELRGFQRCIRLSRVGKELESEMKVDGPFKLWPHSWGLVNEPVAAAIIYPAVLAAWTHVAMHYSPMDEPSFTPYLVFVVGFASVYAFFHHYRHNPDYANDLKESKRDREEGRGT